MENFKPIVGYENRYLVGDRGTIFSIFHNRPVTNKKHGKRYSVTLKTGAKGKTFLVHRLVGKHFVLNLDNKPAINHINGNQKDNRAENLEWVTNKENTAHALSTGLMDNRGESHYRCKITDQEVYEMREIYGHGGISQADIAEAYGIHLGHANRVLRKIARREVDV